MQPEFSETPSLALSGLPEGIQVVRWGQPEKGEWVLFDAELHQAPTDGMNSNLVVHPAPGFTFEFDEHLRTFVPSRILADGKIITAWFYIERGMDEKIIERSVSTLPGFKRIKASDQTELDKPEADHGISSKTKRAPENHGRKLVATTAPESRSCKEAEAQDVARCTVAEASEVV